MINMIGTNRVKNEKTLIEIFKIFKGFNKLAEMYFSRNISNLRGHSMKIIKRVTE